MKIMKSLAALALVLAVVFTMAVPAFAATKDEAYQAGVNTGAPAHHLVELKNYLNAVSFTAEEYDLMVNAAERATNIVNSYSQSMYGVKPADLTEEQKVAVFKAMPVSYRNHLINMLVSLGSSVGVTVKVDFINTKEGYSISATDKNGKVVISSSSKPIVDTSVDYTIVIAAASVVLAVAVAGVVVMSKKVRN